MSEIAVIFGKNIPDALAKLGAMNEKDAWYLEKML